MSATTMQVQAMTCNLYRGAHPNTDFQVGNSFVHFSDQANYVGNLQGQNNFQRPSFNSQNNSYSKTYNIGWRNHLNISYKNQNQVMPPPLGFQPQ